MNQSSTRTTSLGSIIRRGAAATLLAGCLAGFSSGALSAHADDVHNFPAKEDLNGRVHMGEQANAPGHVENQYRKGQNVPVVCQAESAAGIWDKTSDNTWVPDTFVQTKTDGRAPGVPDCPAAGPAQSAKAETTAFTWQDNDQDPDNPGVGDLISGGGIHGEHAGGKGTFDDPITMAVGQHDGKWDFAPGTKIYIPELSKYFIAEDLCGACGNTDMPRQKVDLWIDGRDSDGTASDKCAGALTRSRTIILDPKKDMPVDETPLFAGGKCAA